MGVTASGSGAKGAKALKSVGFFDATSIAAFAPDSPEFQKALEEHAAGNFSTADLTVEVGELDDADKAFIGSSFLTTEDAALIGGMGAFTATTKLGSETLSLALRCISAGSPGPHLRVALFLHGMGEDRCFALWSKFFSPLHANGFNIVSLDLPGFGRASGKDGDHKAWKDMDGELLLRLVSALKVPPGSISVFAEGIGGRAFIEAYAKNPEPFAAHHVLLNVQIGALPSGFAENLESNGADLTVCICEQFYESQTPWMISGAAALMGLLFDPGSMGMYGNFIFWKVKDPEVAKKTGGSGQLGPACNRSMKEGDWWTGKPELVKGVTRTAKSMILYPSNQCIEELSSYVLGPRKKVRPRGGVTAGPEKSAIEMGEINESFQVFIRVRPLLEREISKGAKNCFAISDTDFPRDPPPQRIVVQETGGEEHVKGNYVFNRVFEDSHGQDAVYAGAVKAYVADFLSGTNITVFAYGQTGTGKTHTIMGPTDDKGLIPRCLADIFQNMPAGKALSYEYVQLYMDEFKDLLVDDSKDDLKLVDSKNGVKLLNLTTHKAVGEADILRSLEEGGKRRATRAQDMNLVSSRSHAILMLRLSEEDAAPDAPYTSMFIVDLAGSERVSRSGVSGQGFDEATSINLSLTALGRVVITLIDAASGSKVFVPYNASPLTEILKDGLGGTSKTCLIACVTQAVDSISESVSTLRFAMQASHVKNKVAKSDAKGKADAEKEKIASAGNTLELADGKGIVTLASGDLEIWGSFTDPAERTVILLGGLGSDPSNFQGLIHVLAEKGLQVLAPKLRGGAEKELEADVNCLLELFDWIGLPQPVVYGRDWGAIRAIKFKMLNPKRAGTLVLENFYNKVDEQEYKARCKKDPGYVMQEYMGPFMWMYDSTFPKNLDGKPGANMTGFKGKVTLLWPLCWKGKHDPQGRGASGKIAEMFGKTLKTKVVDSYLMGDAEVADQLIAAFPK